jgi:transcriptional regulator of acetoin/glycerol metabolism
LKFPDYKLGTQTRHARSILFSQGQLPEGLLREPIERSWQRCVDQGLDPGVPRTPERVASSHLKEAQERNLALLAQARPLMQSLYEQIVESGSMLLLTDPKGLILHSLGDPEFISKAQRVALKPGVSWSESERGTNAIGTAAVERVPVLVHGGEHFLERNSFLTCSAAPIFDPRGELAGILDISGDHRGYHKHTMALVRMTAKMIERRLVLAEHGGELLLNLHRIPEFAGTLCEGVAAFSESGMMLGATQSALHELGISAPEISRHSFATLFDVSLDEALGCALRGGANPLALPLRAGRQVFATLQAGSAVVGRRLISPPPPAPGALPGGASIRDSFDALSHGDPRMLAAIERARRVIGRDIPILIEGESGVGKELFAKAFHNAGPRRDGSFVAVNCAAIPEGLIESELFGYDEGAFTGARRRGAIGRIQQADGGTLFLDEIGDMPFALQSRLLRVLQERSITPLGSTRACRVDISLICATHRRLKDEVAKGSFREDLYYRLNGLRFTLPPLRERADLAELVRSILDEESGGRCRVRVSDEVMRTFGRYPWPGNIRQLTNVIRAALALVGDDEEIMCHHLPDDFLEDIAGINEERAAAEQATGQPGPGPIEVCGNLEEIELQAIRKALDEHGGNVSAAARQLGISRNTLYRKLGRL